MGVKFVGVRKDRRGNIVQLLTNDGQVVSIHDARIMAMSGDVDSLTDIHADGTWEIRGTAGDDGYREGYNLDQLPEF